MQGVSKKRRITHALSPFETFIGTSRDITLLILTKYVDPEDVLRLCASSPEILRQCLRKGVLRRVYPNPLLATPLVAKMKHQLLAEWIFNATPKEYRYMALSCKVTDHNCSFVEKLFRNSLNTVSIEKQIVQQLAQQDYNGVKTLVESSAFGRGELKKLIDEYGETIGECVPHLLKYRKVTRNVMLMFRAGVRYGWTDCVKLMLRQKSCNPGAKNNSAIIMAAKKGHVDIIKLLLKDPRVDPTAQHDEAILASAIHCNSAAFKCFLTDPRCNPFGRWYQAILYFAVSDKMTQDVHDKLIQKATILAIQGDTRYIKFMLNLSVELRSLYVFDQIIGMDCIPCEISAHAFRRFCTHAIYNESMLVRIVSDNSVVCNVQDGFVEIAKFGILRHVKLMLDSGRPVDIGPALLAAFSRHIAKPGIVKLLLDHIAVEASSPDYWRNLLQEPKWRDFLSDLTKEHIPVFGVFLNHPVVQPHRDYVLARVINPPLLEFIKFAQHAKLSLEEMARYVPSEK